jgi:hypothetical protein
MFYITLNDLNLIKKDVKLIDFVHKFGLLYIK